MAGAVTAFATMFPTSEPTFVREDGKRFAAVPLAWYRRTAESCIDKDTCAIRIIYIYTHTHTYIHVTRPYMTHIVPRTCPSRAHIRVYVPRASHNSLFSIKRQLLLSGLLEQGLGARQGPEKYRAFTRNHTSCFLRRPRVLPTSRMLRRTYELKYILLLYSTRAGGVTA